jgi:hypothetical protein
LLKIKYSLQSSETEITELEDLIFHIIHYKIRSYVNYVAYDLELCKLLCNWYCLWTASLVRIVTMNGLIDQSLIPGMIGTYTITQEYKPTDFMSTTFLTYIFLLSYYIDKATLF